MTNEQAIEILNNILPAKESYREMIGAPAHCQDMLVWNEPEYYAIEKAIQALEKQETLAIIINSLEEESPQCTYELLDVLDLLKECVI